MKVDEKLDSKEFRKVSDLRLWDDNPRNIKPKDFERLKTQIQTLGQYKPLIITQDNEVIGGNMRLRAYQDLGIEEVWVSVVDAPDEDTKLKYALSDNDRAGYYDSALLANLSSAFPDFEWNNYAVDLEPPKTLDDVLKLNEEVEEDEAPEVDEGEPVSKLGEVYQLGRHYLMCGDSTKIEDVERLMNGQKADMVFTDPPYGINYDDNQWEQIRGYDIQSKRMGVIEGDDKPFDPSFLLEMFKGVKEMFIWGFQYYPEKLGRGGVVAWIKKTDAQKNMLYGDFELCWSKQLRNKMFLFPWGGFNNKERSEGERYHPTQKPVGIVVLFLNNWGKEGDAVVDLFGGSGSTLIACEQLNRTAYLMELDEKYCDVIRKRYAKFIGREEEWEKLSPRI